MVRTRGHGTMSNPFVSVIIPVLRDSELLTALLAELTAIDQSNGSVEIVVANGDATDSTLDAVRRAHSEIRWLDCLPGRSAQMNTGARMAAGRWLLFLHADTKLGHRWRDEIARAAAVDAVGGCYQLEIDSPCWSARVIELGVRWRVRCLGVAYGDQGLFIRRDLFQTLGGYRSMPLMEDADLVRRMRSSGRFWRANVCVRVSARRWERDGWWRRTLANIWILLLYLSGRPPEQLAALYPAWGQVEETTDRSSWRSPTRL